MSDMEGVAGIQHRRDIESALRDIRVLVRAHGLSWEQDAFFDLEHIVRRATGLRPIGEEP